MILSDGVIKEEMECHHRLAGICPTFPSVYDSRIEIKFS